MTGTPTLKPSDLLLKAREEILERGLAKGSLVNPVGEVCSQGALMLASGGCIRPSILTPDQSVIVSPAHRTPMNALSQARAYLAIRIDDSIIEHWNDQPWRTVNEVLDAFSDAALLAKEAGE